MAVRRQLVNRSAAPSWEDGVVVGTGTVGAVLHGDPRAYRIEVTHEEFFLPINLAPAAPRMASALPAARAAAFAGDDEAVARIVADAAAASGYDREHLVWDDPFVPVASLRWTPIGTDRAVGSAATAPRTRRIVNLRSGAATVAHLDTEGETTILDVGLTPLRRENAIDAEFFAAGELTLTLTGDDPSAGYRAYMRAATSVTPAHLVLVLSTDAGAVQPRADGRHTGAATTTVTLLAGRAEPAGTDSWRLELPESGPCRVRIEVTVPGPAPTAAAPQEHADLVGCCTLDLHAADGGSYEDVLLRARAGDDDGARAAVELAFAAGRHIIVSSTGELPPNLVGLWQGTWAPAWSGDYTLNGNVLMGAMAAMVSTGTPELALSLFRLLGRHTRDFAENAAHLYGTEGWVLPARMSTTGKANHFNEMYPHEFWLGCGGWVLRIAADLYSTTGDEAFLAGVAWPLAQQVMTAYQGALVRQDGGQDDCLHVAPSYSPENTPRGHWHPLSVDATGDIAMIRDAARVAVRFAHLVSDTRRVDEWEAFSAALPPYRISADGAFAEWLWPGVADEHAHRHATQLYPFWYESDDAAETPTLRAAAVETIRRKVAWRAQDPTAPPGHMEMAFGLSSLGVAAARLGQADLALRCVNWLAQDHWRPSGVSTHDAGALFNVDACGGLPATVAEMLVQSGPNRLDLLPALPESWPAGTITGLTARGGVIIDRFTWSREAIDVAIRLRPGTERTRAGDQIEITVPVRFGAGAIEQLGGPGRSGRRVQVGSSPSHLRFVQR